VIAPLLIIVSGLFQGRLLEYLNRLLEAVEEHISTGKLSSKQAEALAAKLEN